VRRLPGRGAEVDHEDGSVRDLPAAQALLGIGVAQPMALVEHDDRPRAPRHPGAGEFVVLGPHRLSGAPGRQGQQGFRALVIGEGDALRRQARPRDGAPPLRQRALRRHHQHLGFGHGGDRRPHRQRLAKPRQVAEQEPRLPGPPGRQDRVTRHHLVRARHQEREIGAVEAVGTLVGHHAGPGFTGSEMGGMGEIALGSSAIRMLGRPVRRARHGPPP